MTAVHTLIPGATVALQQIKPWDPPTDRWLQACPCWPGCWVPPSGPVRLGRREEATTGGRG
jgi:hypothetical protein